MSRLYVFAEGPTEQTFADTVLKPYLANFGVYMHSPVLIAHAKKKGIVHRGGGRNYIPMKNDLICFMAQEKGRDVFFTTMIDLYAIHSDFPCVEESTKLCHLPYERIKFLEKAFGDDVNDSRFVPYIQLHEYEAYLFSDPNCFGLFYERRDKEILALKNILDKYGNPELINDGKDTAPSKRIIAEFPDYKKAKSVLGPQLAESIGLDLIRAKCQHFSEWLLKLQNLK